MIALDTSALLRYLIGDDARLADRVARIIEGDEPVGVSTPVLVEPPSLFDPTPSASTRLRDHSSGLTQSGKQATMARERCSIITMLACTGGCARG